MKSLVVPPLVTALLLAARVGAGQHPPVLTPRDSAFHALTRLAYGPRPGEVERVAQEGVMRWIDRQLAPEQIADGDRAAREREFRVLHYDRGDLAQLYLDAQRERRERKADTTADQTPGPVEQQGRRLAGQLAELAVVRATISERQLYEVMVDFWSNHFNVFLGKGADRFLLPDYVEHVIRPHALGRFEDLLIATAESPAILFYLDNWESVALGLNENYGRELMELHTLGGDGGYTQKDVTEVARCFTGWTMDKPRQYADFKFDERLHDPGPKYVLGKKIHAGGMKDGEQVIELLVHHPSTAKFISTKLARRFVSDNPPPSLVNRMAETFKSSDGDIRAVLKTMIWSPEFWSRDAYRAKIKTPFELVVSAARATGSDVDTPLPLVQWVGRIGQPLYQCQPPTGYSDKAEAWVNTGALLNRLNFSLALAGNKMRGARTDVASLLGVDSSAEPKTALDRAVQVFLGGQAAPATVETLQKQLDNPQVLQAKLDDPRKQVDLGVVAGLVLGAPEFQRR